MITGGDALEGNTRSHPEHDGKDLSGRWYCTGDGVGEQVAAKLKENKPRGSAIKLVFTSDQSLKESFQSLMTDEKVSQMKN